METRTQLQIKYLEMASFIVALGMDSHILKCASGARGLGSTLGSTIVGEKAMSFFVTIRLVMSNAMTSRRLNPSQVGTSHNHLV